MEGEGRAVEPRKMKDARGHQGSAVAGHKNKVVMVYQSDLRPAFVAPIPEPREQAKRLMLATAVLVDGFLDQDPKRFQPYLENCFLMSGADLIIGGTFCGRPVMLREFADVCRASELDGILVRFPDEPEPARVTFDIKQAHNDRMLCVYRLWIEQPGGMVEVGHDGNGFSFDNETPRHRALLQPYAIADRLVNCGDYAQFITDGGYQRPELWLSDGWAAVQANGWRHPAYWLAQDDPRLRFAGPAAQAGAGWHVFGLHGVRPMEADAPVSQLSFYEAAAYAEWAGARLPTEFEWEAAHDAPGISQMTGHVWQWTRSSYDPYPGFRPLPGIAAEYNGKFMVGQLVLRGSSVATPAGHARPSYRNFFPPAARWQFSGLRLAKDL